MEEERKEKEKDEEEDGEGVVLPPEPNFNTIAFIEIDKQISQA